MSTKRAVVLLSGGLDSSTLLAIAHQQGYKCSALSFRYGQRHSAELQAAQKIAECYPIDTHKIFDLDLSLFNTSALTNPEIDVPTDPTNDIPVTYVPARNTIFLSIALGWAEVIQAHNIFIGVNAVDYSGYPDCRAEFIEAYQAMANLATQAGVEGRGVKIHTPLISLSKAQIIQLGARLGVDYALTVSCYQATDEGLACGRCDSCRLRAEGFAQAGIEDPTLYINQ